jgi:tetratricopeptide (TPR) repeat protein
MQRSEIGEDRARRRSERVEYTCAMANFIGHRLSSSLQSQRVGVCFGLFLLTSSVGQGQRVSHQVAAAEYDLGMENFREGRLKEARGFLEKATALSPDRADAWKALGLTLLRLNDYAAAVVPLRNACRREPDGDDACYLEGRALFVLSRYDEASKPLEKALGTARDEDRAKIERAMALNLDQLGKAPEAESHFRNAIGAYRATAETREDPRADYGAFLVRQGRAGEALEPLTAVLAAQPNSVAANTEKGRALLDLDRPGEAVEYFQKVIAADPTAWKVRMLLGKTYLRLGRSEEGERELRVGREGWGKANQGSSRVQ